MSDDTKDTRLPPPAFPPGSRKHLRSNSGTPTSGQSERRPEDDAFISPDDPLPERKDTVGEALISPDDPMPERVQDAVYSAFISPDDPLPSREDSEGVVTGMGFDAHTDPEELVTGGDPYVMEVTGALSRLAAALQRKGEAGLKASPQMTRFEATLRAYCVGYLAGRRAEDEADTANYPSFEGFADEG
jgi:hypothetical protein